MESHIQRLKFYFTFLLVITLIAMVIGVRAMSTKNLFPSQTLRTFQTYIQYRRFVGGSLGLLALARQPFQSTLTYESPARPASSVPVLVYHGILDKPDGSAINITTEKFRDQMFALKKAGYKTISTADLLAFMRGQRTLPEKSFMITFDDGRMDSYANGDPIIHALGYRAVMFVISKYSFDRGGNYYIAEAHIKEMDKSGRWDIEAHTHAGHEKYTIDAGGGQGTFFGNKLWVASENRLETDEEFESRISRDVQVVKGKLSGFLEKEIIGFAFPFGDYGQHATNFPGARDMMLRNAGAQYNLLFYQHTPGAHFTSNYFIPEHAGADAFMMRRIDTDPGWTGEDVIAVFERLKTKELPYEDDFSIDRGWMSVWGSRELSPHYLSLRPSSPEDSGAATILEGTRMWENYSIRATVNSLFQNSAFVWVRFQDDAHNAACNFGNGFAHVEQVIGGEKRVIKGTRGKNLTIPVGDFEIEARVDGRHLTCLLNGEVVVESSFLDTALSRGGVGFKTWSEDVGKSALIVKSVDVKKIENPTP